MAIDVGVRLGSVSRQTKKIPEKARQCFARELQRLIDAKYEGNQTKAGKALEISQGHISALLAGDRGPGLNTLILMRLETGKTIDAILGFEQAPNEELEQRLISSVTLEVGRLRAELRELRKESKNHEEPLPVSRQLSPPRVLKRGK